MAFGKKRYQVPDIVIGWVAIFVVNLTTAFDAGWLFLLGNSTLGIVPKYYGTITNGI